MDALGKTCCVITDLDIDPEALAGLFGGQAQEEKAEEVSPDEVVESLEPEPTEPEKEPAGEMEPVMEEEVVENEDSKDVNRNGTTYKPYENEKDLIAVSCPCAMRALGPI